MLLCQGFYLSVSRTVKIHQLQNSLGWKEPLNITWSSHHPHPLPSHPLQAVLWTCARLLRAYPAVKPKAEHEVHMWSQVLSGGEQLPPKAAFVHPAHCAISKYNLFVLK